MISFFNSLITTEENKYLEEKKNELEFKQKLLLQKKSPNKQKLTTKQQNQSNIIDIDSLLNIIEKVNNTID